MRIPLFPLRTVLYPGGPLPLRIFEARYVDMVSACMKNDAPFGVLLIREGTETGPASTYDVGTLARIHDWYQGSDGLLGVTAIGDRRFRLLSAERQRDGLNVGDVEIMENEEPTPLPDDCRSMAQILAGVLGNLGKLYESLDTNYEDAGWVSYRFAEILPISPELRQSWLEISDPVERLAEVRRVLQEMGSNGEAADAG
ncbi:MAG: LON peptidase substrate-binding domain-containing protein [Woeseiaceae bacterium]|nr:LON peptidase substrate-binding domain-containing protein [Woeseiaceae bacterium]